ncbi:amidase [Paenibacillus sp. GYB006]|uniref:amidase n=1 Tax=Paenibacillus sp. GYB006 TaxID=2994394 RepID=UPI002F965040
MRGIEEKTEVLKQNAKTENSSSRPDNWGAFVDNSIKLEGTGTGRLTGLTFAVKDVFNIKNTTSGAGNPDWLRTHGPAESTAAAILSLLANGASLEGTTQTDELMYSLNGENAHYGTPVNPAAPDRIPGGSSSGSAVAVAAELVDFAIGTDTGGSVRIPSSYCGLYGFRPTHGAVSAEGVIPLARSFDTVGWMSRTAKIILDVGTVLLENGKNHPSGGDAKQFMRFIKAEEAWSLLGSDDRSLLTTKLTGLADWQDGGAAVVRLTGEGEDLTQWSAAFRVLQGLEIAQEHGEWIKSKHPKFGPGIAERFEWASTLKESASTAEIELRTRIRSKLIELLGEDGLLAIPTAPGPAPLLGLEGIEAETYRAKTIQLSCIAGLSGLPQVTIPVIRQDGLPIGLSFIGGPNTDLRLLQWTVQHFMEEVRG